MLFLSAKSPSSAMRPIFVVRDLPSAEKSMVLTLSKVVSESKALISDERGLRARLKAVLSDLEAFRHLATSHSLMITEPDAMYLPSGEKATEVTEPMCPASVF